MRRWLALIVVLVSWPAAAHANTVWYSSATDTGPDSMNDVTAGPAAGYGSMCNVYGASTVYDLGTSCTHPNHDEWDYSIKPTNPNACSKLCGMGFLYWWQGNGGYPWAQAGQAFNLTANNVASKLSAPSDSWWHGFTCAQFEDTTTQQQILWCTQPWWQSSNGAGHGSGDHWDPTGWPHDGGPWGDWNPFQDGQSLTITPQRLIIEVERANANLATAPDHQQPYSTNPADYALDGLTCGLEGAGPNGTAMSATTSCAGMTAYSAPVNTTITSPIGTTASIENSPRAAPRCSRYYRVRQATAYARWVWRDKHQPISQQKARLRLLARCQFNPRAIGFVNRYYRLQARLNAKRRR